MCVKKCGGGKKGEGEEKVEKNKKKKTKIPICKTKCPKQLSILMFFSRALSISLPPNLVVYWQM